MEIGTYENSQSGNTIGNNTIEEMDMRQIHYA